MFFQSLLEFANFRTPRSDGNLAWQDQLLLEYRTCDREFKCSNLVLHIFFYFMVGILGPGSGILKFLGFEFGIFWWFIK